VESDSAGTSQATGTGREGDAEPLQETNARLVDSLQELQRERAGDALERVLAEVDRGISGMLTYVEDLRRTREKLVQGVQSVADRLADIDTRAVLGPAPAQPVSMVEPSVKPPAQPPAQPVSMAEPPAQPVSVAEPSVEPPAQPSAQPLSTAQPDSMVEPAAEEIGDRSRPEAGPERAVESAEPDPVEETPEKVGAGEEVTEEIRPVDLVVHGCKSFELVGKVQVGVSGLAEVEGLRVERFHRGSVYMTVSPRGGDVLEDLAEAVGGLEIDGQLLQIVKSGEGRIEAKFPG